MPRTDHGINQKRFSSSDCGDKLANITIQNKLARFKWICKERGKKGDKYHSDQDQDLDGRKAGLSSDMTADPALLLYHASFLIFIFRSLDRKSVV